MIQTSKSLKYILFKKFIDLVLSPEVSEEYDSKIFQMFFTFLRNGKIEHIKRKTLVLNYENGGLNMIDTRRVITSKNKIAG